MRIYETDARVWLGEASRRERRPVTLGGIPPGCLEQVLDLGFDAIWIHGVWEVDSQAREVLRRQASAIEAMSEAVDDLSLSDVDGPPSWKGRHEVRADLGGEEGLELLREDLARRGIRLILDLVLDWLPPPLEGRSAELDAIAALADGLCLLRAEGATGPLDFGEWSRALARVRSIHPRFVLLADGAAAGVGLGEDARLDEPLHAALALKDAARVRERLSETASSGDRLVRFLERPGRARAREVFPGPELFAAALITFLVPGMSLHHDGLREGRRFVHDPRLARRRDEEPDEEVVAFHDTLLELAASGPLTADGFSVRPVRAAWEDNESHAQFVVFLEGPPAARRLVAVNFGPLQGQAYVDLSPLEPAGRAWILQDQMSLAVYERDGNDLAARGLYLDLAPWDYNVFEVRPGRELRA